MQKGYIIDQRRKNMLVNFEICSGIQIPKQQKKLEVLMWQLFTQISPMILLACYCSNTETVKCQWQWQLAHALSFSILFQSKQMMWPSHECHACSVVVLVTRVLVHTLSWGLLCVHFFRSQKSAIPAKRITNIIEHTMFEVFRYSVRGLCECDKMTFTLLLALKVSARLKWWHGAYMWSWWLYVPQLCLPPVERMCCYSCFVSLNS